MNLLNEAVKHESFGEGNVVEYTDSYIKVRFPLGEKKFVFPDAFGIHLTLLDEKIASRVEAIKQKVEEKRAKKEKKRQKERALEYERQQRMLERERLMRSHRLSPASQAVFWVDEEEEERIFTEWQVFTSVRKSGKHKGKPNRLVRLHPNSACLITAREPDVPEEERRILGVFMVRENFLGKLSEDGFIPAHSRFRLRLSPEESKKMLFWKYYKNKRYPTNMTWNSGRHRYFDNVWMAQILRDILELKKGSAEEEMLEDFIEHFHHLNQLEDEELPEPSGALFQIEKAPKEE
ncbi:MAG TPA: malate synthase [Firmicutes bacterium]|nr:malate synthase [Bacillota bacterium]